MTVTFGSLRVGDAFKLENFHGVKQEPRECASSRAFYEGQGHRFDGWNARYQWRGYGEWNELSLAPDTKVTVGT